MLLSAMIRYSVLFGGLAIAIGSIVWGARVAHRGLPRAVVVASGPRSLRTAIVRWLPILAIPVGLGLAHWAWSHRREYIVVTDGDHVPSAVRRYGRDGMNDLPLGPDARSPNEGFPSYVWVLNRSSHAVRVETTSYGSDAGWSSEQTIIPPGTSAYEWEIDHIGPDDRPPPEVSMERRSWLTWRDDK